MDRVACPRLESNQVYSQTNRGQSPQLSKILWPAETKAKVAQNGVKHGLCAQFRVLKELEKQEDFDALLNRLMEDEQLLGQAEIELVVKMAEHTWLANRALRFQNQCFALEPKTPEQVKKGDIPVGVDLTYLEYYVRYHAAQDRAYQRASPDSPFSAA